MTAELIEKMNQALMIPVWKQRNLDVLDELCSPDIDVRTTFLTGHGVQAAKESVIALFTAFPRFDLTVEEIVQQQNTITYKWTAIADHKGPILDIKPSGKTLTFHGIAFLEFKDGLATKYHSFSNMPQVLYANCAQQADTQNTGEKVTFPNHALLLDHENYEREISDLLFVIAKKTNTRLTRRELECLNFWVKGYSIKATARQLGGLSVKTVQVFRDNIRKKFNVISYQNLLHTLEKSGVLSLFLPT